MNPDDQEYFLIQRKNRIELQRNIADNYPGYKVGKHTDSHIDKHNRPSRQIPIVENNSSEPVIRVSDFPFNPHCVLFEAFRQGNSNQDYKRQVF